MMSFKAVLGKLTVFMAVLTLTGIILGADAEWTVKVEHGSMVGGKFVSGYYVKGQSTEAVAYVKLKNGSTITNLLDVIIEYDTDKVTSITSVPNTNALDGDGYIEAIAEGGEIDVALGSEEGPKGRTIEAKGDEWVTLATIKYDGQVSLGDVKIFSAAGVTSDGKNVIAQKNIEFTFEKNDLIVADALKIEPKAQNPKFAESQTGTDVYSIAAADAISVQQFNAATAQYEDVPDAANVKFTAASIKQWKDADGSDVATSCVKAEGGVIKLTPPQYLNDDLSGAAAQIDFTVDYNGAAYVSADHSQFLTVNFTPVATAPGLAVTGGALTADEGAALAGTLDVAITNYDANEASGATDAYIALEGIDEVDGAIATSGSPAWNGDLRAFVTSATFTPASTWMAPYTAVVHDAAGTTTVDVATVLYATVSGQEASSGAAATVIIDVNQLTAVSNFKVTGPAGNQVYADTVVNAEVIGTDADAEDLPLEASYIWFDGDTKIEKPSKFVKGTVYGVQGTVTAKFADKYAGNEAVSEKVSFTCVNSAPVCETASGSLFVLNNGVNKKSISNFEFTVSDADGSADIVIPDSLSGTYGSLTLQAIPADDGKSVLVSASYELTDVLVDDNLNLESFDVPIKDADAADATPNAFVNIKVVYQANPPPKVTIEAIEPIDEVTDGVATAFKVVAKATDDTVYPAGVQKWEISVPTGWAEPVPDGTPDTGSTQSGTWEGSASWIVTCPGYETITGSPRDMRKDFPITVTAYDYATNAPGSDTKNVTVNDVDQLPTAPTVLNPDKNVLVFNDTVTLTPDGADDKDGDAITYEYAWQYSTDNGQSFNAIAGENGPSLTSEYIVKGNIIRATVNSLTHPYGDTTDARSEDVTPLDFPPVCNTAPYIAKAGDSDVVDKNVNVEATMTIAEWSDPEAEQVEGTIAIVGADVDVADTLSYSIIEGSFTDPEAGELSIDEATGVVTFKPALYFNTKDYDGNPLQFSVAVTDGDDEGTNVAIITIVVTEINNVPVVNSADQYVLPDERGVSQVTEGLTWKAGIPDNENAQTATATVAIADDPDGIIEAIDTTAVVDGSNITFNYTVKADAELGTSAKVTLTVTDDGTTDRAADPKTTEVPLTIYVGASPWYPIISFPCADTDNHAGHTVVLTDSDGNVYSITLETDESGAPICQVMPGDYVKYGVPGYTDDTDIDVTVYVWDLQQGTTTEVCCELPTQSVKAYGLPGEATTAQTGPIDADENGWFTLPEINVPMAQSYYLAITDENGAVVQSVGPVDFTADEKGIVLPVISGQKLQLTKEGTYAVSVMGVNPNGTGAETEVATVNVPNNSQAELVWPEDGFAPVDVALPSVTVNFQWPVVSGADSYELNVINAENNTKQTFTSIPGNSYSYTLPMNGDFSQFTWDVVAVSGNARVTSKMLQFTVRKAQDDFTMVITEVKADGGKLKLDAKVGAGLSTVGFRWEYFSVANCAWTNGETAAGTAGSTMEVELSGVDVQAGDYIYLLPLNGATGGEIGQFAVYQIE